MKSLIMVLGMGFIVLLSGCDKTAPIFITDSNVTVLENQAKAISITATDNSDKVTITIHGTDAEYFNTAHGSPPTKIKGANATLDITFKTLPNFEVKDTYTFFAWATDNLANTTTQKITIRIQDVSCADGDVVTHHSIDYCEVVSPYTGSIWLDRNLGADQPCSAFDDALCYGDYYQWGRNADGHEKSTSPTTTVLATQIDPVQASVSGKFIVCEEQYPCYYWIEDGVDRNTSTRLMKWSQTDGSNVCPIGYRVPTLEELKAELLDVNSSEIQKDHIQKEGNDDDSKINAYNTFLRLPSAGARYPGGGNERNGMAGVELWGILWGASSAGSSWAPVITYSDEGASPFTSGVSNRGYSVRCIKD